MTRQLREKSSFHFDAATVQLTIHWHQDRRHSISGQETFNDPGFSPPDPRALLDEFLKLTMEDRDEVVAFLERCGYLVDEPRSQPKLAYLTVNGVPGDEELKQSFAKGLKRATDRELGAWNFSLETQLMQSWIRRRQFLDHWLPAASSEVVTGLANEFRQEVEDANRAFRSGLAWTKGTARLSFYVADAWEAMLAVAHIQKMQGASRRTCARSGCNKLVLIAAESGQQKKYCCKNCRLINNSRRYRCRQRK